MINEQEIVDRAFGKQSLHYDEDDFQNIILKEWRQHVYAHVHQFLKPEQQILELNAGTGIDALYFASKGNPVHATDLSEGMIKEIEKKVEKSQIKEFTCQRLSYDQLQHIHGRQFDYVFSNFGGLNCQDDLTRVTQLLPALLNKGGHVTWVIMPRICVWEIAGLFKGHGKKAFRRLNQNGAISHLEGEYFRTFYYSLSSIKKSFGPKFRFIRAEGLGALSPPPHRNDLAKKRPLLYSILRKIDSSLRNSWPFNRWADHIIVTFQLTEK
jgi:ubiquinone/menaquinone biosynthesis C-methylase UbiE